MQFLSEKLGFGFIEEQDADQWCENDVIDPFDWGEIVHGPKERTQVTRDDLSNLFWPVGDVTTEDEGIGDLSVGIGRLASIIHDIAVDKGWWDDPGKYTHISEKIRAAQEKLLLIHSEVSEATEELRSFDASKPYASLEGQEFERDGKPAGFATELADILIRTMDLMAFINADVGVLMYDKIHYNITRPHRHGGKNL